MYDLGAAAPHVAEGLRLETREHEAYCAGYYMALGMALKVMAHAEERWKLYLRTRRLEARRRKGEQR